MFDDKQKQHFYGSIINGLNAERVKLGTNVSTNIHTLESLIPIIDMKSQFAIFFLTKLTIYRNIASLY